MKTKIEFYPQRLSPPRQGGYVLRTDDFETLALKAGDNIFEESLVNKFRQHPTFIEAIKTSAIVVVSEKVEETKEKNIGDFKNVNDAKKAVENSSDKGQLETWLDQETKGQNRNTVISAIKIALDKLETTKLSSATIS
jgi:hypothetical protein